MRWPSSVPAFLRWVWFQLRIKLIKLCVGNYSVVMNVHIAVVARGEGEAGSIFVDGKNVFMRNANFAATPTTGLSVIQQTKEDVSNAEH